MPPDTVAFRLTHTSTFAVALLMFLGQLAAFTAQWALAGPARLLVSAVRWMSQNRSLSTRAGAATPLARLCADLGRRACPDLPPDRHPGDVGLPPMCGETDPRGSRTRAAPPRRARLR
jgi:hypothetical protein